MQSASLPLPSSSVEPSTQPTHTQPPTQEEELLPELASRLPSSSSSTSSQKVSGSLEVPSDVNTEKVTRAATSSLTEQEATAPTAASTEPVAATTASPETGAVTTPDVEIIYLKDPLPGDPDLKVGHLDNGLTYYIRSNGFPTKERASFQLVIKTGSIQEEEAQRGLAHFVEHVVKKETESFPKGEIIKYLASKGCAWGPDNNAYTSFDKTVYKIDVPIHDKEVLPKVLLILSEVASKATLTDTIIDNERGPILDELRTGSSVTRFFKQLYHVLLDGTPYPSRWPGGLPEVVANCDPELIRQFYRDWYHPGNMAVVAVGDFESEEVERLIKKHFGPIAAAVEPPTKPPFTLKEHTETRYVCFSDPEATSSEIAIYFPESSKRSSEAVTYGDLRLNMIEDLGQRMFNERLKELVDGDLPPFHDAWTEQDTSFRGVNYCELGAVAKEGKMATSLRTLLIELKRVQEHGFLPEELEEAVKEIQSELIHAEEESEHQPTSGLVQRYLNNFLEGSSLTPTEKLVELRKILLETITLDEINELVKELSKKENRIVATYEPKKEGLTPCTKATLAPIFDEVENLDVAPYKPITVDRPLMAELPVPGRIVATKQIDALGATQYTLENGMTILVKPTDFDNDRILINATATGGTYNAPLDQRVSILIAESLADKSGLAGFKPMELERLLKGQQCVVEDYINQYRHGLACGSTKQDLETTMQLLHLCFTKPGYRPEVLDGIIEKRKEAITNRMSNPEIQFIGTLSKVNTQDNPHARLLQPEDLKEVSYNDAVAFHRACFSHPEDFSVVIVGNVDEEGLIPMIQQYLASIPQGGTDTLSKELPTIAFPEGITSAEVRAGNDGKCKTRLTFPVPLPDDVEVRRHASWVSDLIHERLTDKLRLDLGLTYSPIACFSHTPSPGLEESNPGKALVQISGEEDKMDEIVALTVEEIRRFQEEGPTDKELNALKETESKDWKNLLDRNSGWAALLIGYCKWQWDPSFIESRERQLESFSKEKAIEMARQMYNLDNYSIVTLKPAKAQVASEETVASASLPVS